MKFWPRVKIGAVALALTVLVPLLLAGCRDDDPSPSRAEVEEIAREALADMPQPTPGPSPAEIEEMVREALTNMPQPTLGPSRAEIEKMVREVLADMPQQTPGPSRTEIEEIVEAAIAGIPTPQPGLTTEEMEVIARDAVISVPPRSAPAEYTRFFVNNAVSRYRSQGLEATLNYYNSETSIDGEWYVFIIDETGIVIGHPDAGRLGLDLNGWVGTDANGYNFGPEMLSATEDGKWVSYVYRSPESWGTASELEQLELKNVWVVRHDGLLFASGWYINADEFTKQLVSIAVDKFRAGGLPATIAYFMSPGSALAGLEAAIDYYNNAETVDGSWFAFIGDPEGNVVAHSNPMEIGKKVQALFGEAELGGVKDGAWVVSESLRVWVAEHNGYLFGSGWQRELQGN